MMSIETAPPIPRKKGGGDGKAKTARTKQQKENIKGGGNVKAKGSDSASKRSSRREATLKVNRGRGTK